VSLGVVRRVILFKNIPNTMLKDQNGLSENRGKESRSYEECGREREDRDNYVDVHEREVRKIKKFPPVKKRGKGTLNGFTRLERGKSLEKSCRSPFQIR